MNEIQFGIRLFPLFLLLKSGKPLLIYILSKKGEKEMNKGKVTGGESDK